MLNKVKSSELTEAHTEVVCESIGVFGPDNLRLSCGLTAGVDSICFGWKASLYQNKTILINLHE